MLSLVDRIPPKSLTVTRMWITKKRIMQYARATGRIPQDLSQLPSENNSDTEIKDAWGYPIIYRVLSDHQIVLESYGRDHKPGGKGDDRDIYGEFSARDQNGNWNDELSAWTLDPMNETEPNVK
jgi:hypothetical protein